MNIDSVSRICHHLDNSLFSFAVDVLEQHRYNMNQNSLSVDYNCIHNYLQIWAYLVMKSHITFFSCSHFRSFYLQSEQNKALLMLSFLLLVYWLPLITNYLSITRRRTTTNRYNKSDKNYKHIYLYQLMHNQWSDNLIWICLLVKSTFN